MNNSIRHTNLIDRICEDLAAGVVSARTPEQDIYARYGRGPDPKSCWLEYKHALRAYGEEHGTMVLFDDTNGVFLAQMDCTADTSQAEAVAWLDPFAERRFHDEGSGSPMRVTVYRLPRGDYSGEGLAFFETRAEYLWETTKGRARAFA
jgi:hypothetical protein